MEQYQDQDMFVGFCRMFASAPHSSLGLSKSSAMNGLLLTIFLMARQQSFCHLPGESSARNSVFVVDLFIWGPCGEYVEYLSSMKEMVNPPIYIQTGNYSTWYSSIWHWHWWNHILSCGWGVNCSAYTKSPGMPTLLKLHHKLTTRKSDPEISKIWFNWTFTVLRCCGKQSVLFFNSNINFLQIDLQSSLGISQMYNMCLLFFTDWSSWTTISRKNKYRKLLYFESSPPWHLYVLLLANLLAFYLTYLLAFDLAYLRAFYLAYLLAYVLAYLLAFYLAFYLAHLLAYHLANLLAFYLANILALYLAYLLAFYLTFYLTFYLAYLLAFYLAYLLTFYLAYLLANHLANLMAFYLAYLLAFYLTLYLAYLLAYHLAFYLANILALYLAYLLAFYLAYLLAFYLAYLLT